MAEPRPQAASLVLVTDFDGTLYRGDAPIRHYAAHAARALPATARTAMLAAVDRYLELGSPTAALRSANPAEADVLRRAIDGWDVVAQLGLRVHALTLDTLNAAFDATRVHMATDACELEVPGGYRDLLTALRGAGVRVVLATNSPAAGLDTLLDRLELRPLLSMVVSSTAKPEGLRRLLRAELGPGVDGGPASGAVGENHPTREPGALFAVGDHWTNDIEPAVELGVPTGYIDRFGRADGPATAIAPDIEGLLPALRAWAGLDTTSASRNTTKELTPWS
ncbi:HAD family hydrolase [Streptantibioticus parmotrematis]|uniref:HAD family hydrolase n=1 Tax=Streptantibioticus parmotrematis TaxID=2873249 RepID=UPI0033DFB629